MRLMGFEELPAVNSERWLSLEDLPFEEWRDIHGYEGKYQVSCYGRVKSLERERIVSKYAKSLVRPRILRCVLHKSKGGYWYVSFHNKHGVSSIKRFVHRLVAEHFVENPNSYNVINHKDENSRNNIYTNIEWCTCAYNNAYGTAQKRAQRTRYDRGIMKPVGEYDNSGVLLFITPSLTSMARRVGTDKGTLGHYCKSGKIYSNGNHYKYIDRNEINDNFKCWP